MKHVFSAILFVALAFCAGATPPPPSFYGTQEVTINGLKDFAKFEQEMQEEIYDIVNPYGGNDIDCNDWALLWYFKFNGGVEPKRARIFCNNVIRHTFVGVNVKGQWLYIDAQACVPMKNTVLGNQNYDEKDNWEYTDFILSAWYSGGKGNADLWHKLRKLQEME